MTARLTRTTLVVLAFPAFPCLAHAQTLGQGDAGPVVSVGRIVAAVVFCCLVALAVAVLLRRGSGTPSPAGVRMLLPRGLIAPSRVEVIESRRLSPHADLCLVAFEEREFLVLCGAGSSLVLDQRERVLVAPPGDSSNV